jgi:hypothetical protein
MSLETQIQHIGSGKPKIGLETERSTKAKTPMIVALKVSFYSLQVSVFNEL